MATEVEARFRATVPTALRRLATATQLGPGVLGSPHAFEEVDRYLDTADGALARVRWACRLRLRGSHAIVSLKGPPEAGSGGWLHRRPEVEGPAGDGLDPAGWPASDARARLDELRQGRPLEERVALHQRRTERAVAVDGLAVGTLSLDDVTATRDGTELGRYAVVEIELATADGEDALRRLAAALAVIPGLVVEPQTKLERALELVRSPA